MDALEETGRGSILVRPRGSRSTGRVRVDGGKHSFAHTLASAAFADEGVMTGVPSTVDTLALIAALREIYGTVDHVPAAGRLSFGDPLAPEQIMLSQQLVSRSRSLFVLIPALLHRCRELRLPSGPQGCQIGDRPSDWYFALLAKFGVEVISRKDHVALSWRHRRSAHVTFAYPSMTGSVMAVAMAVATPGYSTISNITREPTLDETLRCARELGVRTSVTAGSVTVTSPGPGGRVSATVLPDRIHAVTYLTAGLLVGQRVTVVGDGPLRIPRFVEFLRRVGCSVTSCLDSVTASPPPDGVLKNDRLVAGSEPRFSSDWLPFASLLLAFRTRTTSRVEDLVFAQRLQFFRSLGGARMPVLVSRRGAGRLGHATLDATIHGSMSALPRGGRFIAPQDIRGSAALVVTALIAERTSVIVDDLHLRRGYADLPRDLRALGFNVHRISEPGQTQLPAQW